VARPLGVIAEQAFSRAAGAPLIDGNAVRLLKDARDNYPAWLDAIRGAREWIHFESYIIHEDVSGKEFAEALMQRARAGVRVRLIYDWVGALTATTWMFWERLRKAGVDVRAFNQPRLDSPLGWLSRDHRKMIGVDGEVGFITGLCVGDMWAGGGRYKGPDPWRDTGVEIRGPAVADIEEAFADIWSTTGPPLPEEERIIDDHCPVAGSTSLRVIATKPATAGMFRLDQLVAAMARKTLWITDAYFVGASPYMQALVAAAEDGVDVRMLVPGGTDLPLVQPLTRAGYRQLIESGVRIFEWNGAMVHAKTAVADSRWARVGSSNLNLQSWLGNWELDVAIEDEDFGRQMEAMYLADLENATEIVLSDRRVRRATPPTGPRPVPRPSWSHRTGRTRRAATAGALRLGRTFGDALTARRALGAAEAWTLLYGTLLLGAIGVVGLRWPKAVAYPLGVFLLWVSLAWVMQSIKLWIRRRERRTAAKTAPGRREDAA
jgi:cardiolipin synthase